MVLLEIDAIGIAVCEFECYAPRTIDGDRVTPAGFQGVEVATGQIQIFVAGSILQSIKPPQAPRMHRLLNFCSCAAFKQLLQAFMLEALDHDDDVTSYVTFRQGSSAYLAPSRRPKVALDARLLACINAAVVVDRAAPIPICA